MNYNDYYKEPSLEYEIKYDTGDRQLVDLEVSREQYDRWINNCKKNKSKTSWIYINGKRRKVYFNGESLHCNAVANLPHSWHSIVLKND